MKYKVDPICKDMYTLKNPWGGGQEDPEHEQDSALSAGQNGNGSQCLRCTANINRM